MQQLRRTLSLIKGLVFYLIDTILCKINLIMKYERRKKIIKIKIKIKRLIYIFFKFRFRAKRETFEKSVSIWNITIGFT